MLASLSSGVNSAGKAPRFVTDVSRVSSVVEHFYDFTRSVDLFDDLVGAVTLDHLAPPMCGYVVPWRVEKEAWVGADARVFVTRDENDSRAGFLGALTDTWQLIDLRVQLCRPLLRCLVGFTEDGVVERDALGTSAAWLSVALGLPILGFHSLRDFPEFIALKRGA
jgi:hypothetical protein